MARPALGAVAAAGALAALIAPGSPDAADQRVAAAAPSEVTVRPCRSRAEPGWVPRRSDLVWGPVRSTLDSYARANPADFASRGTPGRYPQQKTPVAVKAGHTVTLAIAREDRRHASFIFDFGRHASRVRVSEGTPLVRLTGCPADEPKFSGPGTVGPWTAFPGAMVIAGARCLTIEVRERNRPTFRFYLGFGRDNCRAPAPY